MKATNNGNEVHPWLGMNGPCVFLGLVRVRYPRSRIMKLKPALDQRAKEATPRH